MNLITSAKHKKSSHVLVWWTVFFLLQCNRIGIINRWNSNNNNSTCKSHLNFIYTIHKTIQCCTIHLTLKKKNRRITNDSSVIYLIAFWVHNNNNSIFSISFPIAWKDLNEEHWPSISRMKFHIIIVARLIPNNNNNKCLV